MSGIRVAALVVAAVALLAACTAGPAAAPETRTVDIGSGPVEIPAAPKRIVVLSGGLAGNFFALDAPVVGTDTSVLGVAPDASGFPSMWATDAVAQGTQVVSSGGTGINLEAVAAAQPDLIVGGGQGITAVQAQEALPQLRGIAPTVMVPTSVTTWQKQLDVIADVIGARERVAPLVAAYEKRKAQVKAAIRVPEGPATIYLSLPSPKRYLVPDTAALPGLLGELGFTLDPVLRKAGNPKLVSTGDTLELSPELVASVADAPNMLVVTMGGPSVQQLAADPALASLPSFASGKVAELPAYSFRPDYPSALLTLDAIERAYATG
ncbi:ABC transporter substrate-binding protein [Actinomycetes bacterium KLBMP 9759]